MEFQKISVSSPPPNTRRATKILREGGGVQKETIFEGVEVGRPLESFFLGGEAPSKIDEQTNSDFAVNRCSKANINVFIDDLLLAVG